MKETLISSDADEEQNDLLLTTIMMFSYDSDQSSIRVTRKRNETGACKPRSRDQSFHLIIMRKGTEGSDTLVNSLSFFVSHRIPSTKKR
jgi:hypothetical protein